jgi:hypothetical protein
VARGAEKAELHDSEKSSRFPDVFFPDLKQEKGKGKKNERNGICLFRFERKYAPGMRCMRVRLEQKGE